MSWRLVFAGEVVIVLIILLLTRRIHDARPERGRHLDVIGALLSAAGLGLAVYGVLRSGEWGWVVAKPQAPSLLGLSLTLCFVLGGLIILRVFFWWEQRVQNAGRVPLIAVPMLRNGQLLGGLTMFFFQFLLQAGLFFTIPLYLSVALGLSAVQTGVRLLPLSITAARCRRRAETLATGLAAPSRDHRARRPAGGHRLAGSGSRGRSRS